MTDTPEAVEAAARAITALYNKGRTPTPLESARAAVTAWQAAQPVPEDVEKESRKFIAWATARIAELENTAKAVSKMHDDSEAEIVTLHDRIKELEYENERLREIEAAARQCVRDDCDAVIHPDCWKRLHSALLKGTG